MVDIHAEDNGLSFHNPHNQLTQGKVAMDKYEVHVTIKYPDEKWIMLDSSKEKFIKVCKELHVKPLYIENYMFNISPTTTAVDILTSSEIECYRYPTAYRYMIDIAAELELAGYEVIRRKIECHPKNWRVENMLYNKGTYFEAHIGTQDLGSALSSRLPISRNRKTYFDGTKVDAEMVTFRRYLTSFETFKVQLENRLSNMKYDMGPGGVETEFCMFDDNQSHDGEWMKGYNANT